MAQFLVLSRHGQTLPNVLIEQETDSLYYSVTGADTTIGLTPVGRMQVQDKGRRLAARFPTNDKIKRIFVSDFLRTQESGDLLEAELGYPVTRLVDPRLNKRSYGRLWNLTYRGVEELFPDEHARYVELGPIHYTPPEGENYRTLFDRVSSCWKEIDADPDGHTLVVCHLVVFLAIEREIMGGDDEAVYRSYENSSLPNAHTRVYCRQSPAHPWQLAETLD